MLGNPSDLRGRVTLLWSVSAFAVFTASLAAIIRARKQRRQQPGSNGISIDSTQCVRQQPGYVGLVGNTPMIRLDSLSAATGCDVFAKVEYLNPGGTGKDRAALSMIEQAEALGLLRPGGTVVEGTSGSTGIALAALCRAKGYNCIIAMPDDQAQEKVDLLQKFGAQVVQVRTASIANPEHYVRTAARLAAETPGAVFMDQFETQANFLAHYQQTAPEIWQQMNGRLDAFVMGAGTGGTLAGVSQFLKERCKAKVFLVDPPGSSLFHQVKHGVCYAEQQAERRVKRHRYDTIAEGIGLDRLTANFARAHIDDAFQVSDQEAVHMAHYMLKYEGLFLGCSSAMNCVGAVQAARALGPGHTVVTVLCDSGSRYVSRFWNQAFVEAWGLSWPPEKDIETVHFVDPRS